MWFFGVFRIFFLEVLGDVSGEGLRLLEWLKERCGDFEMVRMEVKWGEGFEINFFFFGFFYRVKVLKKILLGLRSR